MFEVQIYNISPSVLQGLAFIIGSDDLSQGEGGGYLGWLNSTTDGQVSTPDNFAVEIDFFQDQQFDDPAYYHVGVDINNLASVVVTSVEGLEQLLSRHQRTPLDAPSPGPLVLTVWIEYDGSTHVLNVFSSLSPDAVEPYNVSEFIKGTAPIISQVLDITNTFSSKGMFVGFSGSVSNDPSVETLGSLFAIGPWTFNSDGPAPDVQRNADGTATDPAVEAAQEAAKKRRGTITTIVAATIPSVLIIFILAFIISVLYRRNARLTALAKKYEIEESLLDRGPQNFKYRMLSMATKGFSSNELLGSGGFGSVYKGSLVLKGDKSLTEIAVKRISATSHQGAQEFLAEVKIIGQVQHRNLVRLLGWCHDKGELLLVYDYMPNGSVDRHLYQHTPGELVLIWSRRLKIVSGVATALAYLHEEWEQRVIHRDVKSSNVMLDRDFKARLGDFGLARLSEHDQAPPSTAILAGTYGYIAPELGQTLKPTEKTDVYSFGALVLEVATGKKPLLSKEERESTNQILLVDWVWGLYRDDALLEAADSTLVNAYDPGEMIMFLKIGLLCSHPNPDERPNMREVINIWKGSSSFPPLPRSKPVPVFPLNRFGFEIEQDADTDLLIFTDNIEDKSGAQTCYLDSAGISTQTIASKDVGETFPTEKDDGRKGRPPQSTMRYRRSTTSLPF